ncbi:hypothetical protein G647_03188 [Cladophialophora carrionii CBS 160.54]|uniref:Uncharacterized protein n=1 Tax=Cladophialophora carrionii CBS 160.54 TaxID=1279043 RepID=V9DIC7_9EURO|nr:uncharacterized protein G647_03188 [Cladophialophora carrionii CBS 160.54]ETI26411.1 hypothetical protein G647_03188 [Cladophialophora carrionii CBS 160.54]
MSDLADAPGGAGDGTNKSLDGRSSLSRDANGATSPLLPRHSSQASPPTDQPKKKRKVNHGQSPLRKRSVCAETDTSQHASIADVR